MAKQADVDFVLRAKDLSSKPIESVAENLRELIDLQERQRQQAETSAATLKTLERSYLNLKVVLAEAAKRRSAIERLIGSKEDLAAAKGRVNELRVELDQLLKARTAESPVDGIEQSIKKAQSALGGAERGLLASEKAVERYSTSAQKLGVNLEDLQGELRAVRNVQDQSTVAQARAKIEIDNTRAALARKEVEVEKAIAAERRYQQELEDSSRFERERAEAARRYRQQEIELAFRENDDRARAQEERRLALQKEITAEVQRRDALEKTAAAKRIDEARRLAEEQRVRTERLAQAVQTFSAASGAQLRTPQDRAVQIAREQALRRDAELRMLQINQRAEAVEARLAQRRVQLATATGRVATASRNAANAQLDFAEKGRKSLSFMQRIRGQLLSLAAAYFGLFEAINIGRRAIQTDIDRQGALIRLQVAEQGDFARAAEEFAFVREEADRLGQALTPLANQYSKFKIAAEGAGQSAETTRQVFTDFSEVATVLQLSQDNVEGIFRALEQSFSKGIVQAEELRGQLGDRLPGAFTKLAAAIGVSTEELNKLLEQGKVSANVLPLLGEFLADEVATGLPAATDNLRSALARLNTAFDDFLITLAQGGLNETIKGLAEDLTAFFQSDDGKQFALDIATAFSSAVDAVRGLVSVMGGPGGLLFVAKALVAIQIARWAAQIVTGLTSMAGRLAAIRGSMAATGTAARSMGLAFSTALGPVSLVLTLAAEAAIYFSNSAAEAAEAAAAHADELTKLRRVSGDTLDSLIRLAEKELEAETQAFAVAKAKREEARARLAAAEASLAELKANGRAVEQFGRNVGRPTAAYAEAVRQVEKARDEVVALNEEMGEYAFKQAEIAKARARAEKDAAEANAQGLRLIAALEDDLNEERFKSDAEYRKTYIEEWRKAEKIVSQISRDRIDVGLEERSDSLRNRMAKLRAEIAGLGQLTVKDEKDKEDKEKKRQERLAEQRLAIADRTAKALIDIEGDIASVRADVEANTIEQIQANLENRLAAIDADIAKRRTDLEALRRDAEKVGATESVAEVDVAIRNLDTLEAVEKTREREKATLEQMRLLESQMNDLIAVRDAKLQSINTQQQLGLLNEAEAARQAQTTQEEYAASIQERVTALRDFILANAGVLGKMLNIPEILIQLETLNIELQKIPNQTDLIKKRIAEDFAGGLTDSIAAFAGGVADAIQGVGSLGDAFKAAGAAFQAFLSDFLIGIGKAILQAIILEAIMRALNLSTGTSSYADVARGALTRHSGGMIGGASGHMKSVSPLIFAGAPRFHGGGFPGLRSDEVPVIAQRGEEVLSRTDPRNALNGGAQMKQPDIKVINAIDSASVVTDAMNSRQAQRAVLNFMRANKRQVLSELGIS